MNPPRDNPPRPAAARQPATPAVPRRPEPSAEGAQRRLQALAARSWSPPAIEAETGIPTLVISRWLAGRDDITSADARAVAATYDRIWNREPPAATPDQRQAAEAARSQAATSGWAPPLAWDDDQIDLPAARPVPGWKPSGSTHRRPADLAEDAEFVRRHGGYQDATLEQVAMRLGISRTRLDQAQIRARRQATRDGDAQPEAEAG